ncbi:MAG: hypothetical protein JSS72_10015 [Armatimonadetes bacterium]|nr:hypothetical protein [Armatimonadota bacterium]
MRALPVIAVFLVASGLVAQTDSKEAVPDSHPDVTVTVEKFPIGSDVVEVTVVDPQYSAELLTQQCQTMGQLVGDGPRGLQVAPVDITPKLRFLRARFGLNSIISENGLRLEAIAKALGGPNSPIKEIAVEFKGIKPSSKTIKSFKSDAVRVTATATTVLDIPELEYRILLLTKDVDMIKIPENAEIEKGPEKPVMEANAHPSEGPKIGLWAGIFGFAAALGLLVYSLLSRRSSRKT